MKALRTISSFLAILSLFLVAQLKVAGQVKPQNIYRVSVSSWYKVDDGKRTTSYFTLSQHISDSLGRLHTEVFWDRKTQNPLDIRWHFFTGKVKMKTFFLNNAGVYRIEEYGYSGTGNINRISFKSVADGDTLLLQNHILKFEPTGKLIKTEVFDSRGKRGYVASHKFDANNVEIERKVKGKKLVPIDSILLLYRLPRYDSLNRMVSEEVRMVRHGNRREDYSKTYRYDNDNRLVEVTLAGSNGLVRERREYAYRNDGRLGQEHLYNASGELIDFVAWRYELYKTNDRRERILE